jgi:hypothetical protein
MVKCADCGFLAQRKIATRELRDAEEEFRKTGTVPHQSTGFEFPPAGLDNSPDYVYEIVPLCA